MEIDTRCRSYLPRDTSKSVYVDMVRACDNAQHECDRQIANFPYEAVERPFELALDGADDSCPLPFTNAAVCLMSTDSQDNVLITFELAHLPIEHG